MTAGTERAVEPTPRTLRTRRGELAAPVFVPDATRAVIRTVATSDLPSIGVEALLVSTAHLVFHPGASVVNRLGGVHGFMGWNGPVISDSGGFQVFSLLGGQQGLATVNDAGMSFRFSSKTRFRQLSPRSCIETQLRIGSDILYCLDYCTHPKAPSAEQERSVELTLRWARECRKVFDQAVAGLDPAERPLLFAVVQGGQDEQLRRRCAEELLQIGFDGFGFGGYPIIDGELVDQVRLVADLLPEGTPLHGLGIGTPENLVAAYRAGYTVFDCSLPTRNARRGVLYVELDENNLDSRGGYRTVRIADERWVRERGPLDPDCDCPLCTRLPAGYLAHLFAVGDTLAHTLASQHNIRFYTRLTDALRKAESQAG